MIQRLVRKVKSIAGGLRDLPLHWSSFDSRCSPATKAVPLHLIHQCRQLLHLGQIPRLRDTGRNYSQFDEDGLLLYLFAALGTHNKTFVDIGAGDGINSNCTNLALNHGWHGLLSMAARGLSSAESAATLDLPQALERRPEKRRAR
jgi:hypothetical protein